MSGHPLDGADRLAEVSFSEGRTGEATDLLRRLATEYGFTEWGRRAARRLRTQGAGAPAR